MPKLTKRLVESFAPEGRDVILWDSELPGFGVRIWPSGKRVYVLKYRNKSGRQRKPKIGLHGSITVEQARLKARLWLAEASAGGDPSGERDEARNAPKFSEFAERYFKEHAESRLKPSTNREIRRIIDRVLLRHFGARKLAEITRADIADLHHKFHKSPYQANRVLALLSNMFNMAERWGLKPDYSNPCRHIEKFKEKKRDRYLTREEFSRLNAALNKAERTKSELPSAIAAIRLLVFTGARVSEILTLKWAYIDQEEKRLLLPDSKTGAKIIFLNEPAYEILARIVPIRGNPYVISGGLAGAHLKDLEKPWQRIRAEAEICDVRMHDLRHSFASMAVSSGQSLPMIGGLLGHKNTSTTARYAHLAAQPMHRANKMIGRHLLAAMQQPPRKPAEPPRPNQPAKSPELVA